jgi:ribosome-binding protein aMBF1 (putative translation factor)
MASEWTTVTHKKAKKLKQPAPAPAQFTAIPKVEKKATFSVAHNKESVTVDKQTTFRRPNTQAHQVNARKIEEKAEEGDLHIEKVSHALRMQIQQARQKLEYTQADLARECQLPLKVIKAYEDGSATPNSQELETMSKTLGVTLRK